jgi:hypothetical protein
VKNKKYIQSNLKRKRNDKRIIDNLEEIAKNLLRNKQIRKYSSYIISSKTQPVFIALYTEGENTLPKYFLTYIKGYYIAYHVTNPISDERGDVFAGIIKNFEKFKDDVESQDFTSFERKYFYEYHGWDLNPSLSVKNNTQDSSIYYLIILKRLDGIMFPTKKMEKIEANRNNRMESRILFP